MEKTDVYALGACISCCITSLTSEVLLPLVLFQITTRYSIGKQGSLTSFDFAIILCVYALSNVAATSHMHAYLLQTGCWQNTGLNVHHLSLVS